MPQAKPIFVTDSQRRRAKELVELLKMQTGVDAFAKNRTQPVTDARAMVAAAMINEGISIPAVAQLVNKDRVSVYHYRKKIDMFMNVPGYAAEREVWIKFRDAARNGAE